MRRFYALMIGVAGVAVINAAVVVAEEQATEKPAAVAPADNDKDAVAPGGGCLPGGACCGGEGACAKAKDEGAGKEAAADCPCKRMKKAKEAKEKGAS